MKPNFQMKLTIHPPGTGLTQERWDVWAFDDYHLSDYDARVPASAMSDLIQRTLYKVLP